jgi:DNA polymerase-1
VKVVIDVEANGLENPTQVWVIVCKDIDTGEYFIFRNPTSDRSVTEEFNAFAKRVKLWIGHNFLGYDYTVLHKLVGLRVDDVCSNCIDTLIVSKLVDYPREGHSIEDYGIEFGIEKGVFSDWSKYSQEMEDYCVRDVDICHRIYRKYLRYISSSERKPSILLEHRFQLVVNDIHNNGFGFNVPKASKLLDKVSEELSNLDKEILDVFPPKLKCIREISPRYTAHGTLHRGDFRWVKNGDLSAFNGGPFCRCVWSAFNPSSHKQIIDILHSAKWSPVDRTQTAIDTDREITKLKRTKQRTSEVDIRLKELYTKEQSQKKYGWKINENNLVTLPANAPAPARTLARRILYESRRRTLTEWLALVNPDGRIRGKFYGLGAWTHRMAHQTPNTANIPTGKKLFAAEMRSLWCAPRNRLLVGVDAEGIQLRIFAHYIDDPEFTKALVEGKKHDKTDPHSLNQRIMGNACKSRDIAKRFIYAYLLGAGIGKLAQVLGCSVPEAEAALSRLLQRYDGLARIKSEIIPADAKRGWFVGLDGRAVRLPGDTLSERRHLCMSGYLQNGEAVVMKAATLKWFDSLKDYDAKLVNFVHDEWQTECPNNMDIALKIAKMQADSLRIVGEELNLRCPLAGSYWSEDLNDYTIGVNWKLTH